MGGLVSAANVHNVRTGHGAAPATGTRFYARVCDWARRLVELVHGRDEAGEILIGQRNRRRGRVRPMAGDPFNLQRFVDAQDHNRPAILRLRLELRADPSNAP